MENTEPTKQSETVEAKPNTGTASEPVASPTPASQHNLIQLLSINGPRALAVTVGILYLTGFLVLNAHLNKYGISDLDITNTRYLAAGAIYAYYLILFYLFGGRAIIFGKKWMSDHMEALRKKESHRSWNFVVFIHSLIHTAFFLCLSAALFSKTALADSGSLWFYAFLSATFFIDYTLDFTNLDVRYPKFNLIFQLVIKSSAIYIFFAMSRTNKPISVFTSYVIILMYLNFVLDHFERYRLTIDRVAFATVYTAIFLLISAISFGTLFYGDVSREIGGGKYIDATVGLIEGYGNQLDKNSDSKLGTKAKIIYTTDKYIFIEIHDQVVRLPESAITWLKLEKPIIETIPKIKPTQP